MSFPPKIYLIGAQKAGTTSLAHLLDQHPNLCLSKPKEPDYFTREWHRGESWYQSCFSADEEVQLIDASTSYTLARLAEGQIRNPKYPYSMVPERIYEMAPDSKFIYILREPVARSYSAYWHGVRSGAEKRPFKKAVMDNLDVKSNFYLRGSNYFGQLLLYLEEFPIESFLILFFEDFKLDPVAEVNRCFDFLELDRVPVASDKAKNQSYTYNPSGKLIDNLFQNSSGLSRIVKTVRPFVPEFIERVGKQILTDKIPPISIVDRKILEGCFVEFNARLELLLGVKIDQWKK